jgi:hypothetical protein
MTPAERKEKERQLQELRQQQEQLQSELNSAEQPVWPQKMDVNFCRGKEENFELNADHFGFEGDAERLFAYSLLEVCVYVEVDKDGTVWATHFEGVELPEKVNLSC